MRDLHIAQILRGGGGDYKPHSLNVSHCEARSNEAIQDSKEWIATNATHSRNDNLIILKEIL